MLFGKILKSGRIALPLYFFFAITCATAQAASTLTYLRSLPVSVVVDGVAFDAQDSSVLFVSDTSEVFRISRAGAPLASILLQGIDADLRGLTVFPGGILGANDVTDGQGIIDFDRDGVPGSINIDLGPTAAVSVDDSNGVVFDVSRNTILLADEDDDVIREFTPDGTLLSVIDVSALVGDAEGIEINPLNGNLLIADDQGGGLIVEVTRGGDLVTQWRVDELLAGSGQSGADPLGLALDRSRNELYVAQGDLQRIDVFQLGTTEVKPVPIPLWLLPTLIAALVALAGFGEGSRRRSRPA